MFIKMIATMKNLLIYSLLVLFVGLASCKKEDTTPEPWSVDASLSNLSTKNSSMILKIYYVDSKEVIHEETIPNSSWNKLFQLKTGKGKVMFTVKTSLMGSDDRTFRMKLTQWGKVDELTKTTNETIEILYDPNN